MCQQSVFVNEPDAPAECDAPHDAERLATRVIWATKEIVLQRAKSLAVVKWSGGTIPGCE